MEQLILHLIGDYLTQSDWMALNKTKSFLPAATHALIYSLPFLLLTGLGGRGFLAWLVILNTHFLIDRFRLARYVVWAKNWMAPWGNKETMSQTIERLRERGSIGRGPVFVGDELAVTIDENRIANTRNRSFRVCSQTGYDPARPAWLAVWLMIVADNTLHLAINYAALRWM